jgi:hypothetical protein
MVLAAGTSAFDQPGTLGFLVVFGMAVILTFLFRSMAKHLRRVNTAAARAEAAAAASPDDEPAAGVAAAGPASAQASTPKDAGPG